MPRVQFTRRLQRFFPQLEAAEVPAGTVRELVAAVDQQFPGLTAYIVDDRGALRKHVNIFVGSDLIRDREPLTDPWPRTARSTFCRPFPAGRAVSTPFRAESTAKTPRAPRPEEEGTWCEWVTTASSA